MFLGVKFHPIFFLPRAQMVMSDGLIYRPHVLSPEAHTMREGEEKTEGKKKRGRGKTQREK